MSNISNADTQKMEKITRGANKVEPGVGKDKFLLMEWEEASLKKEYLSLALEVILHFHS